MVESHLDVGGAVVFWSLAEWSDRGRLSALFAPLGLEALVPDPRPAPACLRAALDEVFAGPRVLVRPLASRDGFAVVSEDRGLAANRYQNELTARVTGGPPQPPPSTRWTSGRPGSRRPTGSRSAGCRRPSSRPPRSRSWSPWAALICGPRGPCTRSH